MTPDQQWFACLLLALACGVVVVVVLGRKA